MLQKIGTLLGLFALWLLLSGLFSPFLIFLGVVSSLIAVWILARMDDADGEHLNFSLKPIRLAQYLCWLLLEIARANWAVTKLILSPKMPIRQNLFEVKITQKTDIAQVVFANSITLTPGTITVETEPGSFLVHAVAYDEHDIEALADMDRRVTATETTRGLA